MFTTTGVGPFLLSTGKLSTKIKTMTLVTVYLGLESEKQILVRESQVRAEEVRRTLAITLAPTVSQSIHPHELLCHQVGREHQEGGLSSISPLSVATDKCQQGCSDGPGIRADWKYVASEGDGINSEPQEEPV
jgi:hypothetical protein